jgi:rubredoxin-NAD+ reductase
MANLDKIQSAYQRIFYVEMVVLYRATWGGGACLQINLRMNMKTWMCVVCGFIYDEEQGWPEEGIAPGTRWEDVPSDWACPECGASKDDFEMVVF